MLEKFCDNEGVRIEYLLWPGARATLFPVVLVPGMAASATYWRKKSGFTEALCASGARTVIAVSLRGRGQSACPSTGWTPESHHDDLLAVLAAEKISPCHLIGHSVGGAYALGLALRNPQLAATVVIGDYPPVLPSLDFAWAKHLESWNSPAFHPDFPRRVAAESVDVDYSTELQHLRAPLLVLQGTGATSLLSEERVSLFQRASQLTIVKVDAGHDVFSSRQAQDACVRFLAGKLAPRESGFSAS